MSYCCLQTAHSTSQSLYKQLRMPNSPVRRVSHMVSLVLGTSSTSTSVQLGTKFTLLWSSWGHNQSSDEEMVMMT